MPASCAIGPTKAWRRERGGLAVFAVQADGTIVLTKIARAPEGVEALRVVGASKGVLSIVSEDDQRFAFDCATLTLTLPSP